MGFRFSRCESHRPLAIPIRLANLCGSALLLGQKRASQARQYHSIRGRQPDGFFQAIDGTFPDALIDVLRHGYLREGRNRPSKRIAKEPISPTSPDAPGADRGKLML